MHASELRALLKRAVELCRPDLRAYYRVVRKAKVVKTYASNGKYYADVQPLRNDESVDEKEPVIPRVEIPIMWAGPERGIVCPPIVGTYCDLEYYDGDPNYPRISNFRWHGMGAPAVEIGGLIIQSDPDTYIKIDADKNIIHVTPADRKNDIGKDKTEDVGGNWRIKVDGTATIEAPQINLVGNLSATGAGGGTGEENKAANTNHTGNYTLTGNLDVNGNINASGSIMDGGGNSDHHSH